MERFLSVTEPDEWHRRTLLLLLKTLELVRKDYRWPEVAALKILDLRDVVCLRCCRIMPHERTPGWKDRAMVIGGGEWLR